MKKLIRFTLTGVVIILLGISLASAHGPNGSDDNTNHMNPMNGGMMDGSHMEDLTDHMVVEGDITVEDSILLTLNVSPSEEMIQQMEQRRSDHMGSNNHMGNNPSMNEYMNEITVSFYSLTEFEDNTSNGYSSDDTIISSYQLNSNNLNDPQVTNDTYYTISSKDGSTFTMEIDLKFENELFHGYKWSLGISYDFQSTTSQLAMLHEVETKQGPIMHQHQMQHGMTSGAGFNQYNTSYMHDNDDHMPMFLGWATSVDVDGVNASVTATSEDTIFALSVPQGENIIYDPEISADVTSIEQADSELGELLNDLQSFLNSLNTPTKLGLFLGFSAIVALSIVAIYKRRS